MGQLPWDAVERAAQSAGWKRSGSEWSGPCPSCGGHDRAHVKPGAVAAVIGGCRGCDRDGIALARLLTGAQVEARQASRVWTSGGCEVDSPSRRGSDGGLVVLGKSGGGAGSGSRPPFPFPTSGSTALCRATWQAAIDGQP